ncbi:MAG: glutamate synthase-related protein, partial [Cyanobacteriota bacterium]|nr:glutamate synthase-related protein [Cyanobacteriota bacterium]
GKASHDIIVKALPALTCLEHRGGCSADRDSGDGAGLMTAIPWELVAEDLDILFSKTENLQTALGMVFLPQDEEKASVVRRVFEEVLKAEDLEILGWRVVPVKPEVLGPLSRENQPQIEQIVVASNELRGDELERSLYLARRTLGVALKKEGLVWAEDVYVASFSCRTVTYKGMVRSAVLAEFYTDLKNPAYKSSFAVFHRRFSTNTLPRWPLAQPMRLLGHNGEINTLLGNINWMKARESDLKSQVWGDRLEVLKPFVDADNSDSANLDNVMELLVRSGRSPLETLMLMVPEAYKNQPELSDRQEIIDFYEYYSGMQEAWDGPALLVFSDGKQVGAAPDRNGLRPARYCITKDGLVIVASEAGVVDLPPEEIVEKGRLGPGQMMAVDLESQEVLKNWEIKERVSSRLPYSEWLKERVEVERCSFGAATQHKPETLLQLQGAFGYSSEDLEMGVSQMASLGKEATFCMGDDIPLAVLSSRPHWLYDYFKQRFAQVTNPAIDPLREGMVMSLSMLLGKRGNLLEVDRRDARLLYIESPVLNDGELESISKSGFESATLPTLWELDNGPEGLAIAVNNLCEKAAKAVKEGKEVLILSDRADGGLAPEKACIPPLLAVGAVHHHLIRQGLRMDASLVVDTGQCWSTHHFACLIGYGASAVCPYLALESVRSWWSSNGVQKAMERGKMESLSIEEAQKNYRKAVEAGLLKILSKMGISLLTSYQAAQIFEAIGIGGDLLELGFKGTASRIGGLNTLELARETIAFHQKAFPQMGGKKLENYGFVQYRPGAEYHMNNPEMSKALHKAVTAFKSESGNGRSEEAYDHYGIYQKYLQERPVTALRDLLDFQSDRSSIPIEEVESVEDIVKRFCTGGMSLGALSREAHETLAIAMNRLGGKSNSGEGGEDPARFKILDDVDESGLSKLFPHLKGLRNGDTASSGIKQVASGRFGVTPEYLMNAKQIEIKVAQGAKPGEGGQLPGKKVSPYIATLRRSKAGVPLISPPPHHDIYSIEDLAQLIFDLHQVNPNAGVSVKLVAEVGIGTIAAGVAKANADVIQISGHDGGTGASPLSSIKHAGSPWELGLTEVHRVLLENQLRERVTLRVDGGFKTGWDVLMGALMGAQEFGFGSIAMIAEGCIMARICHTNGCPVGVATQQEKLRRRFTGMPEHVVNFFYFIAEEVRSLLARLGYRSLKDVIGRADLLQQREGVKLTKTEGLDLGALVNLPDVRENRSWLEDKSLHTNGPVLDDRLLEDAEIRNAIENQGSVEKTVELVNTDRSVGGRLAGAIASKYGNSGFGGQIALKFIGSAGQSFGAFNLPGMSLTLEGEANDYVGKGMHGGEIVVRPPAVSTFDPAENSLIGNTCLYGATGGVLFAKGKAGERFAVRNSMGKAVIEGAGDHCCEYMTGGAIVVLGKVGRNVGAGMTGGIGYFLDEEGNFSERVNYEIVKIQRVSTPAGERQLKELIEAHVDRTGSEKAKKILANWDEYLPKFVQVVPPSEAESPEAGGANAMDGKPEEMLPATAKV